jgi:hypothetical protein
MTGRGNLPEITYIGLKDKCDALIVNILREFGAIE